MPDKNGLSNTYKFVIKIMNHLGNKINRDITDTEEDKILKLINFIGDNKIKSHVNDIDIFDYTINQIMKNIFHVEESVDVHDLLKLNLVDNHEHEVEHTDEVNVNLSSVFGFSNISTLVKKVNEPMGSVNNAYLLLDTRYRNLDNDGTLFFKWYHINNIFTSQGSVNTLGNIRDIISMTIMPYRIPAVASAITPYNRISMLVDEFSSQAFIAHENQRVHFMCNIDRQVNNWLDICSDDFCNGTFKFNNPITHLDSITVRFGSPLEPIIFDKDRLIGTFVFGNPTRINFSENHNLATNDIVYITEFTANNSDAEINNINNSTGNIITLINPTSITLPINTTGIVGGNIVDTSKLVYFGSKRIFLSLELNYLSS
jgi:hypothetical protein